MYDPEYICAIIPRRNEISNVYHCSESFASRHLFVQCHLRVGEALHPGPIPKHSDDHIIVGTINPTQILNKEDVFTSTLGPGIWGCCVISPRIDYGSKVGNQFGVSLLTHTVQVKVNYVVKQVEHISSHTFLLDKVGNNGLKGSLTLPGW